MTLQEDMPDSLVREGNELAVQQKGSVSSVNRTKDRARVSCVGPSLDLFLAGWYDIAR
jgi:hypothetical protein